MQLKSQKEIGNEAGHWTQHVLLTLNLLTGAAKLCKSSSAIIETLMCCQQHWFGHKSQTWHPTDCPEENYLPPNHTQYSKTAKMSVLWGNLVLVFSFNTW